MISCSISSLKSATSIQRVVMNILALLTEATAFQQGQKQPMILITCELPSIPQPLSKSVQTGHVVISSQRNKTGRGVCYSWAQLRVKASPLLEQ